MRALADRGGAPLAAGFVMGDEAFEVRLGAGRYEVIRAARPLCGPVFRGEANGLAAVVSGRAGVADAVRAGLGQVEGDLGAAQAFVDRFRLGQ